MKPWKVGSSNLWKFIVKIQGLKQKFEFPIVISSNKQHSKSYQK